MAERGAAAVVAILGAAQTLAWASSYYLPAILAAPMARDLGVPVPWVFGAFSAALVVSALLGPWAGRTIDRRGGRPVLAASSVAFARSFTAWVKSLRKGGGVRSRSRSGLPARITDGRTSMAWRPEEA